MGRNVLSACRKSHGHDDKTRSDQFSEHERLPGTRGRDPFASGVAVNHEPTPADPCHDAFDSGVRDDLTNDLNNLPGEIGIGAQRCRVFFGDEGIVWKCISKPFGDESL